MSRTLLFVMLGLLTFVMTGVVAATTLPASSQPSNVAGQAADSAASSVGSMALTLPAANTYLPYESQGAMTAVSLAHSGALSVAASVAGQQTTSVQYVMAQTDVNIRSGPGANYRVVGWVAAGQIARVTGLSNDGLWWRVVCPDGSIGSCWVTANSQFTQPTTAPGGGTTTEYIVARVGLNIRRGPGLNFGVIGWLSAGQTARVTGKSNNGLWWRIACSDGSTGNCWVSAGSRYTRPVAAPAPGPLPTPVQYILANTGVNIRRGPSMTSGVVGWVAAGQIARVTGISGDGLWWRVVCPDGTTGSCWVTARPEYTQPTSAPGGPPPTSCTDSATLVADISVRDGTQFAPNTGFNKTWRLRNSGSCTWNTNYRVVHAGGPLLGALSSSFPMPTTVLPGQTVDVTLSLISPAAIGNYQSNWKLQNAQGRIFGVGRSNSPFWVLITVATSPSTTISGLAYHDTNQNGIFDHGEPLASDREVKLVPGTACHVARDAVATTFTDRDGRYQLRGNFNGAYCVGLIGGGGLHDVIPVAVSLGQALGNINLKAPGAGGSFGARFDAPAVALGAAL